MGIKHNSTNKKRAVADAVKGMKDSKLDSAANFMSRKNNDIEVGSMKDMERAVLDSQRALENSRAARDEAAAMVLANSPSSGIPAELRDPLMKTAEGKNLNDHTRAIKTREALAASPLSRPQAVLEEDQKHEMAGRAGQSAGEAAANDYAQKIADMKKIPALERAELLRKATAIGRESISGNTLAAKESEKEAVADAVDDAKEKIKKKFEAKKEEAEANAEERAEAEALMSPEEKKAAKNAEKKANEAVAKLDKEQKEEEAKVNQAAASAGVAATGTSDSGNIVTEGSGMGRDNSDNSGTSDDETSNADSSGSGSSDEAEESAGSDEAGNEGSDAGSGEGSDEGSDAGSDDGSDESAGSGEQNEGSDEDSSSSGEEQN